MTTSPMARLGRCFAFVAGCLSCGAAAFSVWAAAPGHTATVLLLVLAILWGLGGVVVVAAIPANRTVPRRARRVERVDTPGRMSPRLGTLMYLGRVPDQLARVTSAVATTTGPVALVVPPGRPAPVGLDAAVSVVDADGVDPDGVLDAFYRACDAVLVVSARAMPSEGLAVAAEELAGGAAWVTGRAEPLNRDRFGPWSRDGLDTRLRARVASAGLWCWEPDATIVRTSLVRDHPFDPSRPLGAWLRARAAAGLVGAVVDATVARRAAPVSADAYWPDTTARQRAGAAELADAAWGRDTGLRSRVAAAGLLLRALSGWSVVWWLGVLVLLAGGSPVRHGGVALATSVVVAITLRWLAPRLATGVVLTPAADAVAGLYALPGSLSATTSAWTRRVRTPRFAVSSRPLVWLGLVATGAAATVVLTAEPGQGVPRVAAATATLLLVSTWVFTVRSLVERSWRRVGFRVPLDLAATVTTTDVADTTARWRVIDGGPGGFALVGPDTGHGRGDEVRVRVERGDASELVLDGTVAMTRRQPDGEVLVGVELRAVHPGVAAWAATLTDGASSAPEAIAPQPVEERVEPHGWGRRLDQLAVGLVALMSLGVVLTLGSMFVGLQPLVVRSGSMEPAYGVGDVVFVAGEQAGDVQVGQVVTRFDAPESSDSLTHRVRSIGHSGTSIRVETRGDANETSEVWTVPVTGRVGVVVASVPAIGRPLTAVRGSFGWSIVAAAAVLGVAAVVLRPVARGRSAASSSGSLKSDVEVPTGSS